MMTSLSYEIKLLIALKENDNVHNFSVYMKEISIFWHL